ncbi:protein of unknown function [Candidatus Hydrogenisulfobacillus filiaventi]|uniref:Glycosyltransferase 2-like domain-containing protein n=1 Tax=Candidatus Hydrogenisulfobacillus filiaventi TaxID=2707344 RepID=A0A6F8ZF23_9FIRM|nr:glycosyltransferase [Bacillota bacterium]CAB1128377.1 protein of unknown function [Candidatus Hydrogenisulfobacillus filiaventi]
MSCKLSILIPALPERLPLLTPTLETLTAQAAGKDVEVLVLVDNRRRSIGEKRNALLDMAQGDFVVFIDDDDTVAPDYVDLLYGAIREHPEADCIVFDVEVHFRGQFSKIARYGVEFELGEDPAFYYRKPNHLMCYARRIARRHRYRDASWGEDTEWAERAHKDVSTQIRIPAVLYHYRVGQHPAYRSAG